MRGGDGKELRSGEVSGIFNNADLSSHKRMDLVVHDPGKQNHLYDLVITNPVTQEVLQSNKVNLQATSVMQRIKEAVQEAGDRGGDAPSRHGGGSIR
jgi:hypothetical protein